MFGEGVHTGVGELFEKKLAPFLTQTSLTFWRSRLWYFQQGLYYQGGMVPPWGPAPFECPGLYIDLSQLQQHASSLHALSLCPPLWSSIFQGH